MSILGREMYKSGCRYEVEARWMTGEWYVVRYYKRRHAAANFAVKYGKKKGEKTRVRELTEQG